MHAILAMHALVRSAALSFSIVSLTCGGHKRSGLLSQAKRIRLGRPVLSPSRFPARHPAGITVASNLMHSPANQRPAATQKSPAGGAETTHLGVRAHARRGAHPQNPNNLGIDSPNFFPLHHFRRHRDPNPPHPHRRRGRARHAQQVSNSTAASERLSLHSPDCFSVLPCVSSS